MKKAFILISGILFCSASWAATPLSIENTSFNLNGKIKVSASGKCYGHKVKAAGASPTKLTANVTFLQKDVDGQTPFTWTDGGAAIEQAGAASARDKINTYDLVWSKNNQSALFAMSGIPATATENGTVQFQNYSFQSKVAKSGKLRKLTTHEELIAKLDNQICSFQWKVSRDLAGLSTQ